LANVLGLDANRNVSLATANTMAIPNSFEGDINALIEEARQRRPDLQAAASQVKAAEASADAARAAGRPSISLTVSANQYNIAGINSQGSFVGINLSVPIFSGYATTYRVRAAEAQVDVKNGQVEQLRLQVALDVWTAYQNLTTATQSLRTTADLLSSAEQSARVALGRYKAGLGSILDVLNAQSALASARQQRIQSTFDWNISRATLAQAVGSLDANLLQTLSDAGSQQPGEILPQKTQP
jgi:outer membrane protein TolC